MTSQDSTRGNAHMDEQQKHEGKKKERNKVKQERKKYRKDKGNHKIAHEGTHATVNNKIKQER